MPSWLIGDYVPAKSLTCLYGKRGQGKTFLALDWACSIAMGRAWQEQAVTRGRVAYLLAERPDGLKRRLMGWLHHAGKPDLIKGEPFTDDGKIHWLQFTQADFLLDVDNSPDPERRGNNELIKMLEAEFPKERPLALLVIDPLAAFMSGSENETTDMQRFVRGCLKIISRLKCSILLIHHEGKGNVNNILGARGSSALEAGMDTVLYLAPRNNDMIAELRVTKQREGAEPKPRWLQFVEQEAADGQKLGLFPTKTTEPPPKDKTTDKKKNADITAQSLPPLAEEIMAAVQKLEASGVPAEIKSIRPHITKMRGRGDRPTRDAIDQLVASGALVISSAHSGTRGTVYRSAVAAPIDTSENADTVIAADPVPATDTDKPPAAPSEEMTKPAPTEAKKKKATKAPAQPAPEPAPEPKKTVKAPKITKGGKAAEAKPSRRKMAAPLPDTPKDPVATAPVQSDGGTSRSADTRKPRPRKKTP
ncbi:hypothetical protein WV31_18995 [Magnetospirillum sp. ME-1]|nr:hypothetical protein WV31_18995 [Magnetospirillum sp. ME-1]